MSDLERMIGKEVVVAANGVDYTGVLIEVSDTEVHLKGPFQWITLAMSSVNGISLKKADALNHENNAEGVT